MNVSKKELPCPTCGTVSKRHSTRTRLVRGSPNFVVRFGVYYCGHCRKHFTQDLRAVVTGKRHFSSAFIMKVKLMRRCSDKTYKQLARELKDIYGVAVATSTVHDWCIDGD